MLTASFCDAQELKLDTSLAVNERMHDLYLPYHGSEYDLDMNYQYVLEELALQLKKDPTIHIHVRGHVCCGDGQRLSRLRAHRVYQFLVDYGAPEERLSWEGYNNRCPHVWPEESDEDEARNRRVDFVLRKLR